MEEQETRGLTYHEAGFLPKRGGWLIAGLVTVLVWGLPYQRRPPHKLRDAQES